MRRTVPLGPRFAACALLLVVNAAAAGDPPKGVPRGPFGLSRVNTLDGQPASIDDFASADDCGVCHPRQLEEFEGSFHSVAHEDPLYRGFAQLALREAGTDVYAFCSGCHTPAGVVTGLVPAEDEGDLPELATAGVTCDVCHQADALSGTEGPWGEPGNGSLVLAPDPKVKRGPLGSPQKNPAHGSEQRAFFGSSELCASCHTVIHPLNGLRIEHTYDEWKKSVYAEKGVQCQDCHMRPVEDAVQVAATLTPIARMGRVSAMSTRDRPVYEHFFVGGNSNAGRLTGSEEHAAMARARLRSAARLSVAAPEAAEPGAALELEVVVANVGAGHALPTSLTEVREMWLEVAVTAADGALLFESGRLDERGELKEGVVRYGMQVADADGEPTFKPWEAASILWKRVVPPKGEDRARYALEVPAGARGPLAVSARLLYRSASPAVVRAVLGDEAFVPEIVEMASARGSIPLR